MRGPGQAQVESLCHLASSFRQPTAHADGGSGGAGGTTRHGLRGDRKEATTLACMTAVSARSMQEEEAKKEEAKVPGKVQQESGGLFPARAVDRDGEHLPQSPLSPLSLSSGTAEGDSVVSRVSPLPIHGVARGNGGPSTPAWRLR